MIDMKSQRVPSNADLHFQKDVELPESYEFTVPDDEEEQLTTINLLKEVEKIVE